LSLPQKPKVGISSCLLGELVRYDGDHEYCPAIITAMQNHFSLTSIFPKMVIGLGTPRETINLVEINHEVHCIGTKTFSMDVTQPLKELALSYQAQQQSNHQLVAGYIFKRGSPSCGTSNVKIIKKGELQRNGTGIYAQQLMECFPHMPVIQESELETEAQRLQFIDAVFDYHQTLQLPT
jgi:uncharacterized protein YbbK (DUF523 family)